MRHSFVTLILALILVGCGALNAEPTITPSPVPTSTSTATPLPSPTLLPTVTPLPEPTDLPTVVLEIPQLIEGGTAPPFDIAVPDSWESQNLIFTVPDVDGSLRPTQLTLYSGPVSGGTGTIVALWGFPNFINTSPFVAPGTPTPEPNLWSDGLRLFRTAMVDRGCNSGTDLQRTYRVGDREGSGTQFAIVDCPESPDTRGWFAGLQEQGLNFVFFVYTEPIEAMNDADEELQAIMDTVRFRVTEEYLNITPQSE